MFIMQDFIDRIRAKKELGKKQYDAIVYKAKDSFVDSIMHDEDTHISRDLHFVDKLLELKKDISFQQVLTYMSGLMTAGGAAIISSEEDIFKSLGLTAVAAAGTAFFAYKAYSCRRAYKELREDLESIVASHIVDQCKEDYQEDSSDSKDTLSVGGVDMSDVAVQSVLNDVSEYIVENW